jgi:hypothetical protein
MKQPLNMKDHLTWLRGCAANDGNLSGRKPGTMEARSVRVGVAITLLLASCAGWSAPVEPLADPAMLALGRAIYFEGRHDSGPPVVGRRSDGTTLIGADAACVRCHRASGLGGVEGQVVVAPISGRALFGSAAPVVVRTDRLHQPGVWVPRPPLDSAGFAGVMRAGLRPGGVALDPLMPRFDFSDAELAALAAHLRTLSAVVAPGVNATTIHFATVIAPGVEPARERAFVDTLQAAVRQIDVNIASGHRQKLAIVERREQSRRRWTLEIRRLNGARDTWAAQLDHWQAQQPAFALLSGIGGGDWTEVHDFCERARVGCWFPSVDAVPETAAGGTSGLYFSAGVHLEAAALASRLSRARQGRVVQLRAEGDRVGEVATQALKRALAASRREIVEITLPLSASSDSSQWLTSLQVTDTVVAWLSPAGLQGLAGPLPAVDAVYLSAAMSGEAASALDPGWRDRAWLVQCSEAEPLRTANLRRFRSWLASRQIAEIDERMQSEVFFAVNFLAATVDGMLNNLHPDYLIERAEASLAMRERMQVQEEVQALQMGGGGRQPAQAARAAMPASAAGVDFALQLSRGGTTAYPRLSLGPGQRFASKGVYLIKLKPGAADLPEWIVP